MRVQEGFRNICLTLAGRQHAVVYRAQLIITPFSSRASSGAERRRRTLKKLDEVRSAILGAFFRAYPFTFG